MGEDKEMVISNGGTIHIKVTSAMVTPKSLEIANKMAEFLKELIAKDNGFNYQGLKAFFFINFKSVMCHFMYCCKQKKRAIMTTFHN
jgi:hypothetical protein